MQDRKQIFEKFQALNAHVCAAPMETAPDASGKEQPKEWVHLLQIGEWALPPMMGGAPVITDQTFDQMLANFARYQTDVLFDWEHESLWGSTRAAGWISELKVENGGLYGKVRWTEMGLADIQSEAYRYLAAAWSNNFTDRKSGNNVGARLLSVALTNDPYFIETLEQELLAARGGQEMDIKKLAALLGLPETATEEQIMTSAKTHKENADKATSREADSAILAGVRHELQLPTTATQAEILAKFTAVETDKNTLAARVKTLETTVAAGAGKSLVDAAQADGKIVASTRKWADEFATRDPEGFKTWCAGAPAVMPPKGPVSPPLLDANGKATVTKADRDLSAKTGLKAEDLAATRVQLETAAA